MGRNKGDIMSILDLAEVPARGPQIITICGDAGLGKSTLAATFPRPIFIRAEDGVARIPESIRPKALPVLRNEAQLWDQLKALISEEHDFKTCVIDTISAADRIMAQAIIKEGGKNGEPAKSIAAAFGGYGSGFSALAARHQNVRNAAEMMRVKRGMNVVFLAHVDVGTVRNPDQDDFSRYSLRMTHKDSLPPYLDDVDAVGFMRQRIVLTGEENERKKAISDETRELVMNISAANVSKNAYGITEPIEVELGKNPLAEFLEG
jgi:hypothetical protein